MIASFGDGATEDLYHGNRTRRAQRFPAGIQVTAVRKLDMLNAAASVLVFRWEGGNAHEVRLTDYH
jgi:plasmid maintenance system killer protein